MLPDALNQLSLPEGRGQAFLNGELTVVNRLRGALVERGLAAEQISTKAYWRIGAPNAVHGEPDRGLSRLAPGPDRPWRVAPNGVI